MGIKNMKTPKYLLAAILLLTLLECASCLKLKWNTYGFGTIKFRKTGQCIGIDSSFSKLELYDCKDDRAKLELITHDVYWISAKTRNNSQKYALEVEGASKHKNARIIPWPINYK